MRRTLCLLLLFVCVPAAFADDPKDAAGFLKRGSQRYADGKYADAVKDFTEAIRLDGDSAGAYEGRGAANFMLGKFSESVADFDKQIALRPKDADAHWRRGISLYYAGKYDDGRKQFDRYQNESTTDVENATWHFMCVTKKDGIEKVRKAILKIGKDARVPMAEVYELYKGKAKPEDVLKAAEAGDLSEAKRKSARFYAHLYLGIYYDLLGEQKKAIEHLEQAAKKYKIDHYMGEVARVHLEVLTKKQDKK